MTAAALLLLLMTCLLCSADADKTRIEAKTGDNVLLPCNATRFKPIKTVEWSRPDDDNKYVISCPNQNSDPVITEDQYKDRVELVNRTTGNVSIYLHDVRTNDSGTYKCYVQGGGRRTKRAVELISTISLNVAPPAPPGKQDGSREEGGNQDGGNTDGLGVGRSHGGLLVAVFVFAAVSVIVSMVITVIRRKKIKTPSPPDDAEKPRLRSVRLTPALNMCPLRELPPWRGGGALMILTFWGVNNVLPVLERNQTKSNSNTFTFLSAALAPQTVKLCKNE